MDILVHCTTVETVGTMKNSELQQCIIFFQTNIINNTNQIYINIMIEHK